MTGKHGKAVCIGFCPTYKTHGELATLHRSVDSVELVQTALEEQCGFVRLRTYAGAEVTAECIVKSVTELALGVQSGTLVFIHFNGHGVKFRGKSCMIADDGAIVPARLLASIVAEQVTDRHLTDVQLVLVFDCCRLNYDDTAHAAAGAPSVAGGMHARLALQRNTCC